MKVRVDGWAWLPFDQLDDTSVYRIKKSLTIADTRKRRPVLHRAYLEVNDFIGVPRSFFRGSFLEAHDIADGTSDGPEWPEKTPAEADASWKSYQDDDLEMLTLVDSVLGEKPEDFFSEDQRRAIKEMLFAMANKRDGVVLFHSEQEAAKVCLSLIRSLKRKTLIVTPLGQSYSMWKTVLGRFLPDASVGYIRRGESKTDDCHVVLTGIDDLVHAAKTCMVPKTEFGFIISHQIHKIDPLEWASAVGFFDAAKRLGIADPSMSFTSGMSRIYSYHLGSPIFAAMRDSHSPRIRRVWSGWKISSWSRANPQFITKASLIEHMCVNANYNKHVVEQIVLALGAGRKIVVLSEKVSHLKTLKMSVEAEWSGEKKVVDFVLDGMAPDDIEEAVRADVMLTTFDFVKSFPEIPEIDTVVLATPVRDPLPAARVCLYRDPGKKSPIIVDMRCDAVLACKSYGKSRDAVYERSYGEQRASEA